MLYVSLPPYHTGANKLHFWAHRFSKFEGYNAVTLSDCLSMMKSRVAEEQTPVYLTFSALIIDIGEVADKILAPEINGSSSSEIQQRINFKPYRQQQ